MPAYTVLGDLPSSFGKRASTIDRMAVLFPFHATFVDYTDAQCRVYHDRSECAEAKKILTLHRIDGSGGRQRCKQCGRIESTLSRRVR